MDEKFIEIKQGNRTYKRKYAENNISRYRYYRGISQTRASELIGINVSTLRIYEQGGIPKYHIAKKISDVLGFPINKIFKYHDEES